MTTIAIDVHDRICQDLHQQIRSLIVENERLKAAAQQALEALEWISAQKTGGMIQRKATEPIAALRAALAEPVQEPVAWSHINGTSDTKWHPPQRKPLTEEELDALAIDEDGLPNSHIEFARAIERAHGIGGQP